MITSCNIHFEVSRFGATLLLIMASVYDAVINSYEAVDPLVAEWTIAESQGQDDLRKNVIRLYAALLVNSTESNVKQGYLVLQSGHRLGLINEMLTRVPTELWGQYGWSTWCYNLEDAIKEAIASNSRGPTMEVDKQIPIHWLIMEMEMSLSKIPHLLKKGLITTGKERNNISSLRMHGNIPGNWITTLHMAVQWEMTHKTWADIKLSDWKKVTDGFCRVCGKKEVTWDAYCASCWVEHLANKRQRTSAEAVFDCDQLALLPP